MTTTIDQQIQSLFAKLNTRKTKVAELESQIAKSWITNCSYRPTGASSPVNLNTLSVDGVVDVVADIVLQAKSRADAAALLGTEAPKKIQGYTVESWVEDCKKRLAAINIREEKKALEELETRLNSVLSPEERRKLEVAALLAAI